MIFIDDTSTVFEDMEDCRPDRLRVDHDEFYCYPDEGTALGRALGLSPDWRTGTKRILPEAEWERSDGLKVPYVTMQTGLIYDDVRRGVAIRWNPLSPPYDTQWTALHVGRWQQVSRILVLRQPPSLGEDTTPTLWERVLRDDGG